MGTQIVVANPSHIPQPEYLAPQEIDVEEYNCEIHAAAKSLRVSSMRIAFYGFRMKMADGWTAWGFESGPRGEEAYIESVGIPRSTWFRLVRVGQAMHQLPLAELEKISVTNAEILLSVSPTILYDHNWVFEAKTLPSTKLAALVAERNKVAGDDREPLTILHFKVPVLAKQSIDEMLDVFKDKNMLSSRGQAIEFMVADLHDRTNLLASVDKALKLIKGAYVGLSSKKISAPDEMYWIELAMEALSEAREKAVQAARSKPDRGKEGRGA
jgi:hypothetical protein